jgi:hypothetical protein
MRGKRHGIVLAHQAAKVDVQPSHAIPISHAADLADLASEIVKSDYSPIRKREVDLVPDSRKAALPAILHGTVSAARGFADERIEFLQVRQGERVPSMVRPPPNPPATNLPPRSIAKPSRPTQYSSCMASHAVRSLTSSQAAAGGSAGAAGAAKGTLPATSMVLSRSALSKRPTVIGVQGADGVGRPRTSDRRDNDSIPDSKRGYTHLFAAFDHSNWTVYWPTFLVFQAQMQAARWPWVTSSAPGCDRSQARKSLTCPGPWTLPSR